MSVFVLNGVDDEWTLLDGLNHLAGLGFGFKSPFG
ncbi:Uncharacterised protein [Chlamydia trachomatis]|nr:Uncharacterised protein [Chlamydia trachomatis]